MRALPASAAPPPGTLRASARIVARATGTGRTSLPELRSAVPILLRRTAGPGPAAWVHLVGGAAGPLGGDQLRLEIVVGPGAVLRVRSVAATVVLPGAAGESSAWDIEVRVEAGGLLDFSPEPMVVCAGAKHTTRARIDLAAGAGLRWREELVCGRAGEQPGTARSELMVRSDGRPLLAHAITVGPGAPGWNSAGVLGEARAAGTVLYAGTEVVSAPPPGAGPDLAVGELEGPGVLVTAVAADALILRRAFDRIGDAVADRASR